MQKLHFITNVLLKNIIGKDLINDDNVAIQELVKNSFDAGSKKVEIIFRNIKENKDALINNRSKDNYLKDSSKIIIADSGEGMSVNDLQKKWLNIAYSSKKSKKEKFGRTMAGEKGVGRFSCDRLGEYLDIYTKSGTDTKINHLTINWNDFEIENDWNYEIQKVDIVLNDPIPKDEFKKKTGFSIGNSGTILEISKLREKWILTDEKHYNYDKLIYLKTALEKLTNPNQNIDKNSFVIDLKIEDLKEDDFDLGVSKYKQKYDFLTSPVENKIFEKLSFRTTSIESEISKNGGQITTSLKDKDRVIFTLVEKNVFKHLKDIRIVLYFLNQYSKAYFKRQTGIESVNFGSIFLFINGFRVSPFGDPGNDWLGLEMRKGQGRARYMGARDLQGRVEINDSGGVFKIISNREGLVKNEAHDELVGTQEDFTKSYFYSILRKLEIFVVDGLDWDRIQKSAISRDNIEEDEKFEVKEYMKQFHDKLKLKTWKYNPADELYAKSQEEKDYRVIKQIDKIILAGITKKQNIISLYINEEILQSLANENVENLNSILNSVENFDTEKFNLKTSKGVNKIKEALRVLLEKAKREEGKREEAEKERDTAREEAEKEKKRAEKVGRENLFLKSITSRDLTHVINLHHHIGISSDIISKSLGNMKKSIDTNEMITPEKLNNFIKVISYEINKIKTITKFATKANFDAEGVDIEKDLAQFIKEYLLQVCGDNEIFKAYDYSKLNIDVRCKPENLSFNMWFKPIEITMIFDNLVSNSVKARAKNIDVIIERSGANELIITYQDDGKKKILDENLTKIFDYGFTTTEGSGIGLYHVKTIVEQLGGEISVKNRHSGGAEFLIKLRRS